MTLLGDGGMVEDFLSLVLTALESHLGRSGGTVGRYTRGGSDTPALRYL